MRNATRNWKTTATGIAGLLAIAAKILGAISGDLDALPAAMEAAADPAVIAGIVTSIGLILAKDSDKTGTADTQRR